MATIRLRRIGLRSTLDEIHVRGARLIERIPRADNALVLVIRADQAHFANTNLFVNAILAGRSGDTRYPFLHIMT